MLSILFSEKFIIFHPQVMYYILPFLFLIDLMVRKLVLQEVHHYQVYRECHPFRGYPVHRFVQVVRQRQAHQGNLFHQEYQMDLNLTRNVKLVQLAVKTIMSLCLFLVELYTYPKHQEGRRNHVPLCLL